MDKRSVVILGLTAWFIAGIFGVTFGFNTPSYDWFSFGLLSLLLAFTAVALLALADPPAVKHYRTKAQNLEAELDILTVESAYLGNWLDHYIYITWSSLPHRVIEDSVRVFIGWGDGVKAVLRPVDILHAELANDRFHFVTEEGEFIYLPSGPPAYTETCTWTTTFDRTVGLKSLLDQFDVKEDAAKGVVVAKRLSRAG